MSLSNTQNLTTQKYIKNRDYNIKKSENDELLHGDLTKLNVHYDSKSFAMGYGYDIIQNLSTLKNDLREYVRETGESDESVNVRLDTAIEYINAYQSGAKTKENRKDFVNNINNTISLQTEANATALLGETIQKFETSLSVSLGSHDLLQSNERATVISQLYRLGSSGAPSLLEAIRQDNRAEAWFQIRYYSNADELDGNYTRVVNESNLFGLYDNGNFEIQAKEVMRMYTFHKSKIEEEQGESSEYNGVNSIISQIKRAKNYLISQYGEGVNINGEVIVGKGLASYDYIEGNNDHDINLQGTNKNDLIFGERGNDYIKGGKGEDILLGDDGKDTLVGGEGSDDVLGGKGNDSLIGEGGADYLEGGSGYDTYIAAKDDTIIDNDGKGKIQFNGVDLTGVKTKVGKSEFYEDNDYATIFQIQTTFNEKVWKIQDDEKEELNLNIQTTINNELNSLHLRAC